MPNRRFVRTAALVVSLAGTLAVVPAAAAVTVTVRVQGPRKTMLPTRKVVLPSGSITRGGAPAGACSAASAQGALAVATHGNWQGSWYSSYSEYFITEILGLPENGKKYYWGLYVDNRFATSGACQEKLTRGASVVFAAVPAKGATEKLLGVNAAPARAGRPYRLRVVAYSAVGKAFPVAGATVKLDGQSVTTTRHGWTSKVTFRAAGVQTVTVSKRHYVGTETTVQVARA
ncbi:MAG: DUF4430 domain-containing protein [Solirubrobacteraceae bacterium]